ncbi:alpha/beta hydrolase family esterase [Corynebacterium striatum]|uniref:alpha/beta hydrolase family esterase n=1 Tax=Corynebacterium striatum TaxID=43770 RepID=UPI000DFDD632|nr:PHB depolymerase family esterase [Corynebacterium striatum]MDK8808955.1 alpha/beta hydrolase-fold protein [Corynebacterium striatum]MDK8826960.1 alpha/beta hydrolase-fold protein [Corynebacterium striatum]STD36923.1 secreted esterase B [Corynebacterium striatum]
MLTPNAVLRTAAVCACLFFLASCATPAPIKPESASLWDKNSELGIPVSAPFDGPEPGESRSINLPSGRNFIVHVPEKYDPEKRWPLVMVFHGWGEEPKAIEGYTEMNAAQAIVVYPAGVEKAWTPAPYAKTTEEEDLKFVADMVDSLRATYAIDDNRIFAAGLSNGGGFAAFLACRMPETFHSIATVSAAYYEGIHKNCSGDPVGRLDMHGTDDPVVEYYGGTRHGTKYDSVSTVMETNRKRNQCTTDVTTMRLVNNALQQTWVGCKAPLQHIRIGGGSHIWPGGRVDDRAEVGKGFATDRVLDFFGVPGRPAGTEDPESGKKTS